MCLLCIVWLNLLIRFNLHVMYISMRMFHVVALSSMWIDGWGCYNMVSELKRLSKGCVW
jgi:hypothetical protein